LLAERAGIQDGQHWLDAGCGVFGPAIDIARVYPQLQITGITLSPSQARHAKQSILQQAMGHRLEIQVADYHALPFADESFDGVYFFESLCYAEELPKVIREFHRVLRPGGWIYAKDVFVRDGELSAAETRTIEQFNANWVSRLMAISTLEHALSDLGFGRIKSKVLTASEMDCECWFTLILTQALLGTRFGLRHIRGYGKVLLLGEVKGQKFLP
jgi:ubiquinone/menaquinone biosynthesis C-methylase UbiE